MVLKVFHHEICTKRFRQFYTLNQTFCHDLCFMKFVYAIAVITNRSFRKMKSCLKFLKTNTSMKNYLYILFLCRNQLFFLDTDLQIDILDDEKEIVKCWKICPMTLILYHSRHLLTFITVSAVIGASPKVFDVHYKLTHIHISLSGASPNGFGTNEHIYSYTH